VWHDPCCWQKALLEVGCGVGNTIFPMIDDNPDLFVYGIDFSPRAIEFVRVSIFVTVDLAGYVLFKLGDQLSGACCRCLRAVPSSTPTGAPHMCVML